MTPEIIGRYRVSKLLGRGGFAVVYLANDPFVKRQVAVKVLPAQFTDTVAMRARFQQEAEIIAALEHPAIVPIYDYGDHEGQPFIVMRYMSGGSLAERIQREILELGEASKVLKRISSALDRAHDQGIIHRDLKPGNILFDQYGEAYLSDFGIARLTEASLKLTGGGAIGTPAYMSPEQVYGDRPVDGRSDIYALGVILFEMLTGNVPYDADTPAKLMLKHILEPVPRILNVKPDLPEGCERLLEKAMAKEPENRFSKASDFTAAVTLLSPTLPSVHAATPQPVVSEPPASTEPKAADSDAAERPVEATVIETPTPPEVRRVVEATQVAAETTPASSQETAVAPVERPAEKPTRTETSRPSWFRPGLIAGGALLLILLLVAFVIFNSDIFGGDETADPSNENNGQTTSDNNISGSTLRPTAGASGTLPEAEGVLTPRQVGNFERLAQLGRGYINGLAVSADGSLLAAGGGLGVWVYDTATLEPITLLEGHTAPVRGVAWSPEGPLLASAGEDGVIKIWNIETALESGTASRTLEGHEGPATSVAWSFDGRYLASGSLDNTVRIWDMENGQTIQVMEGHEGAIRMVAWPPSTNERVASASEDMTARLWSFDSGEQLLAVQHTDIVESAFWSANGSRLITGADDNMIHIWDSVTGDLINEWSAHEYGLITLALSSNGRRLVSTGIDGYVRLWNPETGEELASWSGPTSHPVSPAWLPDNDTLALSFGDNWLGIWRADDPQDTLTTHAHTGQVGSIAWTPEGRGIVSGHFVDELTYFWNLETREPFGVLSGFTGDGPSLSIAADGSLLARANVGVEVFDLTNGFSDDLEPFLSEGGETYMNVAALSPDASQVASVDWDGFLRVWNISDQLLTLEVGGAGADTIAWSPDGRFIATPASEGPFVVVWDSQTGERLQDIAYETDIFITGLDWSPDGRFLASTDTAGAVHIWDSENWGLALSYHSLGTSLNSLDWSPDGRWLAAGAWSGSVYVWDATGAAGVDPVLFLDLAHLAPVVAVAWSPDSTHLASGGHDGAVRIWGIEN